MEADGPVVQLGLLGGCSIRLDDVEASELSGKARAALAYLATTGVRQPRPHLAALLWSDLPDANALAGLRKVVGELRRDLPDALDVDRRGIGFAPGARVRVDAVDFSREGAAEDDEVLERALRRYAGGFLDGVYLRRASLFDEWREGWSTRLRALYHEGLQRLAGRRAARGERAAAVALLQRLLAEDPLHEAAHLELMRLHLEGGRRGAALAQYRACRSVLAEELGAAPMPALTALHDAIASAEPPTAGDDAADGPPVPAPQFVVGPPITRPHLFFGRAPELERILHGWQEPPFEHVAVIGRRRSGKTSLLRCLPRLCGEGAHPFRLDQRRYRLGHGPGYRWIHLDFQDPRMRTLSGALSHLLRGLGLEPPPDCTLERFMDLASERRGPVGTLVLMDELAAGLGAEELDQDFWWTLRSLTQITDGYVGLALASHEPPMREAEAAGRASPFFNIFKTLELGPLEPAAARELVDSAAVRFRDEDVDWILDTARGWPCPLQILCQECELATRHGSDPRWREAARERLLPHDLPA